MFVQRLRLIVSDVGCCHCYISALAFVNFSLTLPDEKRQDSNRLSSAEHLPPLLTERRKAELAQLKREIEKKKQSSHRTSSRSRERSKSGSRSRRDRSRSPRRRSREVELSYSDGKSRERKEQEWRFRDHGSRDQPSHDEYDWSGRNEPEPARRRNEPEPPRRRNEPEPAQRFEDTLDDLLSLVDPTRKKEPPKRKASPPPYDYIHRVKVARPSPPRAPSPPAQPQKTEAQMLLETFLTERGGEGTEAMLLKLILQEKEAERKKQEQQKMLEAIASAKSRPTSNSILSNALAALSSTAKNDEFGGALSRVTGYLSKETVAEPQFNPSQPPPGFHDTKLSGYSSLRGLSNTGGGASGGPGSYSTSHSTLAGTEQHSGFSDLGQSAGYGGYSLSASGQPGKTTAGGQAYGQQPAGHAFLPDSGLKDRLRQQVEQQRRELTDLVGSAGSQLSQASYGGNQHYSALPDYLAPVEKPPLTGAGIPKMKPPLTGAGIPKRGSVAYLAQQRSVHGPQPYPPDGLVKYVDANSAGAYRSSYGQQASTAPTPARQPTPGYRPYGKPAATQGSGMRGLGGPGLSAPQAPAAVYFGATGTNRLPIGASPMSKFAGGLAAMKMAKEKKEKQQPAKKKQQQPAFSTSVLR